MAVHKKSSSLTFILFSIVCLVAFLSEYIFLQIEQFIYDKNYFKFTITESIVHWVLMCVIWGMIGTVLFYLSTRVYRFDTSNHSTLPSVKGWIISVILLGISVATKMFVFDGWKVLLDFHNSGWFQFIFQYIYYLFEAFIILLTVIFAQEAGERITKLDKVPWGGILLALTWGLSHIITQSSLTIGLLYVVISLLFGITYISVKKNFYISYGFIALMFLI